MAMFLNRKIAAVLISVIAIGLIWVIVTGSHIKAPEDIDDVRALSTENTRLDAWESMWTSFSENLLLGAGSQVIGSENSLLLILARTGLVGGIPFMLSCSLMIYEAYRLLGRTNRFRNIS